MPDRPVGVADTPNAAGVADVYTVEVPSATIRTTLTADPGASGTSLAVTSRSLFPQSGDFKIRVDAEVMLVTAGHGAGAGNFTVTRAQDGTTGVAHSIGAVAAQVVAVQAVYNIDAARIITYKGRVATFRTTGRAGTIGQKLFAIHNATDSAVMVKVNRIKVDVVNTAVRAIGVEPALIRLWKFTAVPTNGTQLTKVPRDSSLTSSSSVTVWGDASADKTGSGTTLTITLPAGTFFSEEYGPRNFTAVGQEGADRITFLEGETDEVMLRPLEGVCVFLDYATATFNPVTDFWTATCDWEEYTPA